MMATWTSLRPPTTLVSSDSGEPSPVHRGCAMFNFSFPLPHRTWIEVWGWTLFTRTREAQLWRSNLSCIDELCLFMDSDLWELITLSWRWSQQVFVAYSSAWSISADRSLDVFSLKSSTHGCTCFPVYTRYIVCLCIHRHTMSSSTHVLAGKANRKLPEDNVVHQHHHHGKWPYKGEFHEHT